MNGYKQSLTLLLGLTLVACASQPTSSSDKIVLGVVRGKLNWPAIYLVSAEGTGEVAERLPRNLGGKAEWSPDGQWIAFSTQYDGRPEQSTIYLMRADGTQLNSVVHNVWGSFDPSWSPDGKYIVYSGEDNSPRIYILNVECFIGGEGDCNPTSTSLTAGNSAPDWSPDGKQIAYEQGRSIFIINADGTGQPINLTQQLAYCWDPQWSPDGAKTAFSCGGVIYLVDPDGSNLKSLSQTGGHPRWSPDGSKIAFISMRDGLGQIIGLDDTNLSSGVFLMNADGNDVIRLSLRDDESVNWFTWMPSATGKAEP